MRLVCPNCEAKYEVPDDAIPDTGRDVQCTNCNHTWFQMRGRTAAAFVPAAAPAPVAEPEAGSEADTVVAVDDTVEAAPAASRPQEPDEAVVEEAAAVADAPDQPVPDLAEDVAVQSAAPEAPEAEPAAETLAVPDEPAAADGAPAKDSAGEAAVPPTMPVAESDPVAEAVAEIVAKTDDGSKDAADASLGGSVAEAAVTASAAPAAAYAVDDSVLAILREEAEREANARRAEALESQTDLGIDQAMPRKAGAAAAEAEAKPTARRDLLPDVEEINSTLRPSEMHVDADGTPDFVAPPPEAPRGFRSGFLTLMTIAILAAALYLISPRLAVLVPALAGPLESYVSFIDSLRLGLDGVMRSATVAISDQ